MKRRDILNLYGTFIHDFGRFFFIETSRGNFVWSCPDFNGDDSLIATRKTFKEWIGDSESRNKGFHNVGTYIAKLSSSRQP